MNIDSQGTEMFLSPDGTTILRFPCPTAINGIGFTTDSRVSGCLDAPINTPRVGRKTLNSITVPFEVQAGDEAHQMIIGTMNNPLVEMPYIICDSQGVADPTLVAGAFVAPADRDGYVGKATVSNLTIDYAGNADQTGSFTLAPRTCDPYFHTPA